MTIQDDADVVSGIEVFWKDDSDTGIGNADDKLHLLVMNEEKVHILKTSSVRSDQSAEITLPVSAGDVHVYAFFGTADGDEFSPDSYSKIVLS